jgi:membrane-anchored protein YejM (alkaline phosphatase superfamily)
MRNGGSYLDNLALADRELGEFMSAIKSTRSAANTILIVCSDHSWRVPMWRRSVSWTEEDEQASKRGFDTRPVLLAHFPQQTRGITIMQPMSSLVMHSLLEEMLRGKISDESGIVAKF